jgi:hypothetical protein
MIGFGTVVLYLGTPSYKLTPADTGTATHRTSEVDDRELSTV